MSQEYEPSKRKVQEVSREIGKRWDMRLPRAQRKHLARNFLRADPYYGRSKPVNPWDWDHDGHYEDRTVHETDLLE